jgi:chemotaxis protein methyltransferase CheR
VESEFATPWPAGTRFDLILCRNVMIYFAPAVNLRLVGQFHASLGDGGWLVVGASESNLLNYRAFRRASTAGATLYQKMAPPPGQTERAPEPAAAPQPAILALCKPGAQPNRADLQGLRQLADRGDWQDAADYGRRLLADYRLNPAIHFYLALTFEKLGIADEPERSLRQAIYLDRNFALAHYHLGLALQRGRQPDAAARSFENVLKVLAGTPEQEIVTAGPGVTAAALKDLAKMHLAASRGL